MRHRRSSASSLTDSLRSAVRLRRAVPAVHLELPTDSEVAEGERGEQKRPRRSRFSIGFAPLTSITESDAQISGGETRQDY
ncbi:hypothetical protein, partial [Escherichia coli]|uniref:hypothetical protein n=1 Tax=Escherichia coli TaxID=562 RepID=UPI00391D1BC3